MNIKDIHEAQFRAMLDAYTRGEDPISSGVAYAFTGDLDELSKLGAVDFSKLKIERYSACDPSVPEALDWVETQRLNDGLAICFEGGPVDTSGVEIHTH